MSGLKRFLDRRAENIAKEKAKKEGIEYIPPKETETHYAIDPEKGIIETQKEIEEKPEDPNLSDEEFWDISNEFNKKMRISKDNPVEVMQKILERYTPLKINQFAERYEKLNQ